MPIVGLQSANGRTESVQPTRTKKLNMITQLNSFKYFTAVGLAALSLSQSAHADLTHRYSFTTDASDSIGGANGTLVDGANAGTPTVSGGQLQFNNNNFSGPSSTANYLSLPASIMPASGSVTIEEWFTFTGSGFFTESYAFRNSVAPSSNTGQYLMHTISAPQGGPVPAGGGSHIAQTLAGYGGGAETDAFGTTTGIGAGGGGYLDDGGTYMAATVIDGTAGTLSYYLYRVSDGLGGLQQTIAAIPLSSYSFTDAFLGRSAFDGDNATSGSFDEFRIYDNAQGASAIAADFAAGPNTVNPVPEPSTLALSGLGGLGMLALASRRSKRS